MRLLLLFLLISCVGVNAQGNRLAYLDAPSPDPYYVGPGFAKLTTPRWIGEDGVEAVAILSIDDMRDTAGYENYLRPIIDRLKAIDGRAPVSIFTCQVDPQDMRLQKWLKEGLSIEVHTIAHPCPLLGAGGSIADARATVHNCIDLLAGIPNSIPMVFRMPCCDSQNSLSPRFFSEIFSRPTAVGNLLKADSSVFTLLSTPGNRLEKYVPKLRGFVNYIRDYPYPYVIGGNCWEFPSVIPSDWEAQDRHGSKNPETIEDLKAALDRVVEMQGLFTFVFHPHGWIGNDQVNSLIDHAVKTHGKKLKFMTFPEVIARLEKNVLGGRSLQDGVRLFDANGDGIPEVHDREEDVAGAVFGSAPPIAGRLLDLDGDGQAESVSTSSIFNFKEGKWSLSPVKIPDAVRPRHADTRFVDLDGDRDLDIIVSSQEHQFIYRFEPGKPGWVKQFGGQRKSFGEALQIPPFVRKDGTNNGAWLARGRVFWQNEDVGRGQAQIIKRSFDELMKMAGAGAGVPMNPEESLRVMQPREGFRVDLVAAEPLVMDPVDIAWGPDGRMWVAEMADYPMGIDNKGKAGARIAVLADTTGDGILDKRSLFAAGLETANTVLPWRDGALVVAPPQILFMRDVDHDGRADERKVLYEGFGRGNEQHRGNGLAWGLDGWLYVANGDSGGTIRSTITGKSMNLGGFDLRIRPDTGELEPATGMTQHGRNRDDWGNWIAGNNSGAWQIALEDDYIRLNPKVQQPPARNPLFGVMDLYPSSHVLSHWSGYRRPPAGSPGKLTSGCGYTFYRDNLFNGLVEPSLYFSCPVHNCIHREVIRWNGILMQTSRAEDEARSEFLRSADSWFRPTAIRTGPDGGMYVADMYRFVIEHPKWIEDNMERRLIAEGRLRAGHDRGRIYRILPDNAPVPRPLNLASLEPKALAGALDSPNGWVRDTVHMMLTWLEGDARNPAIPELRNILKGSMYPAARAQALGVLAGLDHLSAADVDAGLDDPHQGVRRNALRLGASFLAADATLGGKAVALLGDEDPGVQREAAYALGNWQSPAAGRALGSFLVKHAANPYLRAAALTSSSQVVDEVLLSVMSAERTPATVTLTGELLGMLGEDPRQSLPLILKKITVLPATGKGYESWKLSVVARLLEIYKNDRALHDQVAPMFAAARAIISNEKALPARRLAAIDLLARSPGNSEADMPLFISVLKVSSPIELQVASLQPVLEKGNQSVIIQLLAGWGQYSPVLRSSIVGTMLSRSRLTRSLLTSLPRNPELLASLDTARREFLLQHKDEIIRKLAAKHLGSGIRADRESVIKQYAPSLAADGDSEKGRALFASLCAACHRLDGVGREVGPDLAALTDRSSRSYLTAILDPNRAIQENWMTFVATTGDQRLFAGALAEETSSGIVLIGADGVSKRVARTDLKSLKSTGRSLMPEGLEEAISVPDMGHLLAYLRTAGSPHKKFVNNTPRTIRQAADGNLALPASAAALFGPSIIFEQQYRNIGYWGHEKDRAEWAIHLDRAGEYDLWVDWALNNGHVGGRIRFMASGQVVADAVPGTRSWDIYRWGRVGRMKLPAGRQTLLVSSEGPVTVGALIDLRAVRLIPAGSKGPAEGFDWTAFSKLYNE
ncbi:MAG: c-type cytochrome [Verrucomicrobiaceae bacterium]|nr:c-type cytochrome [Verrucomicrobiaceae bacterium]